MNGTVSNVLNWLTEPAQGGTVKGWLLGAVIIFLLAFLWSRVVKQLLESA